MRAGAAQPPGPALETAEHGATVHRTGRLALYAGLLALLLVACCSHCGLLLLQRLGPQAQSAVTFDFVSRQTVNARGGLRAGEPGYAVLRAERAGLPGTGGRRALPGGLRRPRRRLRDGHGLARDHDGARRRADSPASRRCSCRSLKEWTQHGNGGRWRCRSPAAPAEPCPARPLPSTSAVPAEPLCSTFC